MNRSKSSPGRFVVIVGPDGVGKTTLAEQLMTRWGRESSRYFHFRPSGNWDSPEPGQVGAGHTGSSSIVIGWLRLLLNWCRVWVGYLRFIRPGVRAGRLIVGDRWLYSYLLNPESVRYAGPPRLAKLALRLLPTPDLVIALRAPAETIRARKAELSLPELRRQLGLLPDLPGPVTVVEADTAPDELANRVMSLIDRAGQK